MSEQIDKTDPPKKPGRKMVVFGEKEADILREYSGLLGQKEVCGLLGIKMVCLHAVFKRQPEMRALWDRGAAMKAAAVAKTLHERAASDKSMGGLIFLAKTQNTAFQNPEMKAYVRELEDALMGTPSGRDKMKSIVHRFDGSLPSDTFPDYHYASDKKGASDDKKLDS